MSKPTPRPWKVSYEQPYEKSIDGPDGQPIYGISVNLDDAPVPDYNAVVDANAAHIVKCVNMHEELVATLNGICHLVGFEKMFCERHQADIKALVAKARAE